VSDVAAGLSEQEIAELCALADGTLPSERRAAVAARVAASPELQDLVDRQRRAVTATQALASEPVPTSLREAVEARRRPLGLRRGPASRLVPRLAVAGGLAVVLVAVLAVVLSGGPGAPTVAAAARLAERPPSGPAPPPVGPGGTKLALAVEGVVFPDLARPFGWRAVGVRRDRLDGRNAALVFYAKDTRRIAYVIVAGSGLPRPSGAAGTTLGGVLFQTLRVNGRLAVTWRRDGRTCVLIGTASRTELLRLANWRGYGTLRY
jgi:anti-sigma factor RsiW